MINWSLVWAAVLILLILALLAAAETALTQVGLHRVRKMLKGDEAEDSLKPEDLASVLTMVLVLRIGLILALGGLSTAWAEGTDPPVEDLLSLAATLAVLVLVGTSARKMAKLNSERVAARSMPTLLRLSRFFNPLLNLLYVLAVPFGARNGNSSKSPLASLEDIHEDILVLQRQGVLERDETEMLQSIFTFGDTIAREVMVPRVDLICIELGSPVKQVMDLVAEHGYSRLPVFKDNIDHIVGIVHIKDLLRRVDEAGATISEADCRAPRFVPGTKKIPKILRELQEEKSPMAVVLDEYGGTEGILTLEDIVEEIVGEITDEYDKETDEIVNLRDGTHIVDARMILEDVNEQLELEIPVDEHETLGGYVYGLFGRVPVAGEVVDVDGLRLTVAGIERQRITLVRVERCPLTEDDRHVA